MNATDTGPRRTADLATPDKWTSPWTCLLPRPVSVVSTRPYRSKMLVITRPPRFTKS